MLAMKDVIDASKSGNPFCKNCSEPVEKGFYINDVDQLWQFFVTWNLITKEPYNYLVNWVA